MLQKRPIFVIQKRPIFVKPTVVKGLTTFIWMYQASVRWAHYAVVSSTFSSIGYQFKRTS